MIGGMSGTSGASTTGTFERASIMVPAMAITIAGAIGTRMGATTTVTKTTATVDS